MRELTTEQARRIAVRAQLLDANRPSGLIETVQRLGVLQNDPTNAVARNADLVLWTRLGSGYAPEELHAALDGRALIELSLMIRPAEDLALHRAEMAARRDPAQLAGWQRGVHDWVMANDACRRDILRRLERRRPARRRRAPRHVRRAVAFDRLDQRPQRQPDARGDDGAR